MRAEPIYVNEIARRSVRRLLRLDHRKSTPTQVLSEYEVNRRSHLDEFMDAEWDAAEYALREPEIDMKWTFSLIEDGKVHFDLIRKRRMMLEHLKQVVARYEPADVTEAGSGTGRNLVWLASQLGVSGNGLELTPSGAEVGQMAAKRYGLDLTFQAADLTDPAVEIPPADVVFSLHALEQIPNAAPVVDKMVAAARKAVIMIEPFPEFWPGGLGRLAHRLRAEQWDRLRAGAFANHTITSGELLSFGTTVNRPSQVIIEK